MTSAALERHRSERARDLLDVPERTGLDPRLSRKRDAEELEGQDLGDRERLAAGDLGKPRVRLGDVVSQPDAATARTRHVAAELANDLYETGATGLEPATCGFGDLLRSNRVKGSLARPAPCPAPNSLGAQQGLPAPRSRFEPRLGLVRGWTR